MERVRGCSIVDNIRVDLPTVLTTMEQVRKELLSESPIRASVDVSTQSLAEFPQYEMLQEKFRNALNELDSMLERARDTFKKSEDVNKDRDSEDADWNDPFACQLENLLTQNLYVHLCRAVQKIVKHGYTEEAAQWAVLNSNLLYGNDNLVSNVVHGALALLERSNELKKLKHPLFEELKSVVDYTLLEMVHVVREVRPEWTIAESMWSLVISDMNLVKACGLDAGSSDASHIQELPGENSTLQQGKSENSCTKLSDSAELDVLGQTTQISKVESSIPGVYQLPSSKTWNGESTYAGKEAKEKFMGRGVDSSHDSVTDAKSGCKKALTANTRREILRQKVFPFDKNFKARMLKGSVKAKVAALGGLVLEKPKLKSGSSSVIVKGALLTGAAGNSSSFIHGSTKDSVSEAAPEGNHTLTASISPMAEPCPLNETNIGSGLKSLDYYALIPFDEADQRYVPQDEKDEAIMVLVPHKQCLEKELAGWTDWANKKVMDVAQVLRNNQVELQIVRQEKEEIEKFKKEKQSLEESTLKRLSEMDFALANATGQIEGANYTLDRLEGENSALQKDMEMAKLNAQASAHKVQEAMKREQEVIKKVQLCEVDKGLVLEQMNRLKCEIAELDHLLEKAKEHQNRIQILLRQEEEEKAKAAGQVDALRAKKEKEEISAAAAAESMKRRAEINMLRYEEVIKNLEGMISELRRESDKSKIAALSIGYGNSSPSGNIPKISSRLAISQDSPGSGDVYPERECIVCMADEISVVFLPCAHQVLCEQCSNRHEKQGMKECPSCRTIIEKRICVSYRTKSQ